MFTPWKEHRMHRTKWSVVATVSLGALIALASGRDTRHVVAQTEQPAAPQAVNVKPSHGRANLPGPSDDLLAKLESAYKDIHGNPELAMQEHRTAGIAAGWLR